MTTQNLLVELFVEELPPKALKKLGEAFGHGVATSLAEQRLVDLNKSGPYTVFASPRRLAVLIPKVVAKAEDEPDTVKLMPVSVGWDGPRNPTPALLKRLNTLGCGPSDCANVYSAPDGKTDALFLKLVLSGATLAEGL